MAEVKASDVQPGMSIRDPWHGGFERVKHVDTERYEDKVVIFQSINIRAYPREELVEIADP